MKDEIINIIIIILLITIAILIVILMARETSMHEVRERIGGGSDDSLLDEYNNLLQTDAYEKYITDGVKNDREKYEILNALEWALLLKYNYKDDRYKKELKRLLTEKKLKENVDEYVEKLFEQKVEPIKKEPKYYITKTGDIIMGKFRRKISQNRLELLRRFGSDTDIVKCALRYASILARSQQWNIPEKVYKIWVEKYKLEIEGFASPFNSQIIKFGKHKFGSLFKNLDKVFGSIGNIFEQNLVGKVSTLNPPFVIDIMDSAVNKAIEKMEQAKIDNMPTIIFMVVPNWEDAEYYKKLDKIKEKTKILLTKYTYYYENSNDDDKKVIATFNSSIFILRYPYEESPPSEYSDIISAFK